MAIKYNMPTSQFSEQAQESNMRMNVLLIKHACELILMQMAVHKAREGFQRCSNQFRESDAIMVAVQRSLEEALIRGPLIPMDTLIVAKALVKHAEQLDEDAKRMRKHVIEELKKDLYEAGEEEFADQVFEDFNREF